MGVSKVSPSLLSVKDVKLFLDKLDSLKEKDLSVETIHIDVMDGEFVSETRILHTALMIELEERGYLTEVHLMVKGEKLESQIDEAVRYNASKIWIHVELEDAERYLNIFRNLETNDAAAKFSMGLAINPETDIDKLVLLKDKIDSILVMSVHPGKGGQKLISKSFTKIKKIREAVGDNIEIVVDGGINRWNIQKIFKCGASKVVVGKYLCKNLGRMKSKLAWIKKHIV